MIKSGEYIQLLQFFSQNNCFMFINNYAMYEQIEIIEACKRFDEVRLIHNKIKKECENWLVYPNKNLNGGLDKLKALTKDMEEVCRQFKIRIDWKKRETIEFRNGIHADYFHESTKITNLIIFSQERKESNTSH